MVASPPLSPSAAEFVSRGSFASLLGWKIWYIDSSSDTAATATVSGRAPLVLLHGFPTSSLDWAKVYPELSSRCRVIALDFLGFGLSEKPRGYAYTISEQADLAAALCDELGLGHAHLLVHDYGCTVAQELLARTDARGRWLSCCFLNGGLFPETHRPRLVQQLLLTPLGPCLSALMTKHTFARSLSAVFAPATQPSVEDLRDFWALVRYRGGSLNAHRLIGYIPQRVENRERWVGALQKTSVPLGLINGSLDPVRMYVCI